MSGFDGFDTGLAVTAVFMGFIWVGWNVNGAWLWAKGRAER